MGEAGTTRGDSGLRHATAGIFSEAKQENAAPARNDKEEKRTMAARKGGVMGWSGSCLSATAIKQKDFEARSYQGLER